MKRPQITEGERFAEDGVVWTNDGKVIATVCDRADKLGFDPRRLKPEQVADCLTFAAIPAILAVLESAYLRACQDVRDAKACEYEQITIGEMEAHRDEYKTALQSAGYTFDTEPEQLRPVAV